MSEMAKIVQQQRLENMKLEKLFSDSKIQALQLSEALSLQQENPPADPWDKFVPSEVTGYYYTVARGRKFDSFGIYVDVSKFIFEVMGVGSRTRDRGEAGPALVTKAMSHQGKTYARGAQQRRKCKEKQIPASSHF
jgi:hypothetical protein